MSRNDPDPLIVDEALKELLQRVADGQAFPDACWRTSQRHKVSYIVLRAAYDDYCASH